MLFAFLLFFSVLFDLVLYFAGAGGKRGRRKLMREENLRSLQAKRKSLSPLMWPSSSSPPPTKEGRQQHEQEQEAGEAQTPYNIGQELAKFVPSIFVPPLLAKQGPEPRAGPAFANTAADLLADKGKSPATGDCNSNNNNGNIGNYEFVRLIQQGGTGAVYLGKSKATGEKFAIKVLRKTNEKTTRLAKKEATTMMQLSGASATSSHDNHIVRLKEVIENEENVFLVMQWGIAGDLFEYVDTRKRVDEEEVWRMFEQVVEAVDYAHRRGFIHRDIKPGKFSCHFFSFY